MTPGRTHPSRTAAPASRATASRKAIPSARHENTVILAALFYKFRRRIASI
jgi:hypothetical protein